MPTLLLPRGDTREWNGQAKKPDANGVPQPYPLEGAAELRFTVKNSIADVDADAVIQKSNLAGTEDGIFIEDAPTGKYRVKVDPADSAGLTPGRRYVYDVQLKDSTGTFTVTKGTLLVDADVTQTA